jgi:aspartyl-tRNA(Asn)/glutamyl-tRNA(Gln) amidotransferase subunit B
MQEGSLRCDANISLKPQGSEKLGTKAELKNMNSFKALGRALLYEIERQEVTLEEGKKVVQETRRWDESKQRTLSMRGKEQAHDYRYFPEPDLIPIELDSAYVSEIRDTLPELPVAKREKFISIYGLPEYDAGIITGSKFLADFFEKTNESYYNPKATSNFIMGELMRLMNEKDLEFKYIPVSPTHLGNLLKLIDDGKISVSIGKKVFETMFETGKSPETIVQEQGLIQISDESELLNLVQQVIKENPKSVEDFLSGKEKAIGFLVGQIMKLTKGKANPQVINKLIISELKKAGQ